MKLPYVTSRCAGIPAASHHAQTGHSGKLHLIESYPMNEADERTPDAVLCQRESNILVTAKGKSVESL
jgi:hypothetical protein